MKRKLFSALMALMLLLTAVGCGTAPTSSSEPEPAPYLPDPAPAQTSQEFIYDDELGVHEFTPESSGYYLLEVWGAQSGNCTGKKKDVSYTRYGGQGGYAKGYVWLNKGEPVYVCVGGKGGDYDEDEEGAIGGVLLGAMESGVWQGDGKAVITWVGNTEDTIPEGLTIPQA